MTPKTRITGVVLREAPFHGPAVYEYVSSRVLSWADAEAMFPSCTAQWDTQRIPWSDDIDNCMLVIINQTLAAVNVMNGRIVSWHARWDIASKTWRVRGTRAGTSNGAG